MILIKHYLAPNGENCSTRYKYCTNACISASKHYCSVHRILSFNAVNILYIFSSSSMVPLSYLWQRTLNFAIVSISLDSCSVSHPIQIILLKYTEVGIAADL